MRHAGFRNLWKIIFAYFVYTNYLEFYTRVFIKKQNARDFKFLTKIQHFKI